jgi:hypothetical protein
MSGMTTVFRVLAVATVCVLIGSRADAQFKRGVLAASTEINLFPAVPPALLLPAGTFEVAVENQSTAPARLLARLASGMTKQLAENDPRLRAAAGIPELRITASVTDWTRSRRRSTRDVPEIREIGTQTIANGEVPLEQPRYDYGRNKPNVIDEGAASVRVEVRRGTEVIASETTRVTYLSDRLVDEGVLAETEVEDLMIDRVARRAAGVVTPGREPVTVKLARSDEIEKLNGFALNQQWRPWLSALQAMRPHGDAKRDAYRLYNLGVAHEALAYAAPSDDQTQRLLEEAAELVQRAIAARPDEKYFTEASERIATNSLGYERLRTMRERR